jgi:hypothetical protein
MIQPIDMMTQEQHRNLLPLGDSLQDYIDYGFRHEGSFLSAIIENDLVHAAQQADMTNKQLLFEYAMYIDWYAPDDCWGSKLQHEEWTGLLTPMKKS